MMRKIAKTRIEITIAAMLTVMALCGIISLWA